MAEWQCLFGQFPGLPSRLGIHWYPHRRQWSFGNVKGTLTIVGNSVSCTGGRFFLLFFMASI
jgi:hypothetical protein